MRVICTAGHVDHGKSSLIRALTGIDPDRLKEEKTRQMTIDLGFAWLDTPGHRHVGVVDVPGHQDFVGNMLSGLGGIDIVLFVVAADEGIKPQTVEHLAIIDQLEIQHCIVVITKTDLVSDKDILDLVESEVQQLISTTSIHNARFAYVSTVTGAGLDELVLLINDMLDDIPEHKDIGMPRLPVDRVFSLKGFGTIVTGTLSGGSFHVGDTVQVFPSLHKGRIRGIEAYNEKLDAITPGSRAALNLAGIDQSMIRRGDVIGLPGKLHSTKRITARVEFLKTLAYNVQHNQMIRFHLGTTERIGRIRFLDHVNNQPGLRIFVEIEFDDPVACLQGDRFIIRRLSPEETIGGGIVLQVKVPKRNKLADPVLLEGLNRLLGESVEDKILARANELGVFFRSELQVEKSIDSLPGPYPLKRLLAAEEIITIGPANENDPLLATRDSWKKLINLITQYLQRFHKENPLSSGVSQQELTRILLLDKSKQTLVLEEMQSRGIIKVVRSEIALAEFEIKLTAAQLKKMNELERVLENDPFNPPSVLSVRDLLGSEIYASLVKEQKVIQVSPDVFFRKPDYDQMVAYVYEVCGNKGGITVAQFRDHFHTSRKFSLALLEYLDMKKITTRDGDVRRIIARG